ncbi:hypothetical protein ACIQBJ_16645 [Kitasatospora sp. NPDC088391]|uniref:hypothetical protein n=1 Tax=Kitasatospora sp. NPDC088391 TaxID=3364074 RepID=UPI0037F8D582
MRSSVITRTALGCLAVGLALTLSACDSPGSSGGGKAAKNDAAPAASPSDDHAFDGLGEQLAMLNALEKEFPGITEDKQKAVDSADELCKDIRKNDGTDLGMVAASLFATTTVSLGPADGQRIVTVVKASTCA